MKYLDFHRQFKQNVLVDIREVKNIFPDFDNRRLYEWQKQGYLKNISRQFYVFSDMELRDADKYFIANRLFEPSYISLEYALGYYSLIPETVHQITSITTRKTKIVDTPLGAFQYRSLKENLFFGYVIIKSGNVSFKIAELEKALLDFLYLRSDIKNNNDIDELRIDWDIYREKIDQKKMNDYLQAYDSKVLYQKFIKINKKSK